MEKILYYVRLKNNAVLFGDELEPCAISILDHGQRYYLLRNGRINGVFQSRQVKYVGEVNSDLAFAGRPPK